MKTSGSARTGVKMVQVAVNLDDNANRKVNLLSGLWGLTKAQTISKIVNDFKPNINFKV